MDHLRYQGLANFDRKLQELDECHNLLEDKLVELLSIDEDAKRLVYRRGPLVFAFNFHPSQSYADLRIPVPDRVDYRQILNTDNREFDGFGHVAEAMHHVWDPVAVGDRKQSIQIYLPSRSAQVFAPLAGSQGE